MPGSLRRGNYAPAFTAAGAVRLERMKRVLLLAYAFPPEPLPGALRPGYLARYLEPFGWKATVVTPARTDPPFDADVVHAGSAAPAAGTQRLRAMLPGDGPLRRILRGLKESAGFPDELAAWIPVAAAAGLRTMRAEHHDAILSTALPMSTHIAGAVLSVATRTPWVADYRDLWSGNPYMPWGPVKRTFEKALEKTALRRACQITTVSSALAAHLSELHKKDVTVIENAYDSAEWDAVPDESPLGFDLVYTGTMYSGKRSPELLLQALLLLKTQNHPAAQAARLHFYGRQNETVLERARDLGLDDIVFIHGVVPREEALRAQRRSAAVLIFLSMDPATAHETGSKYLEYVGARRPMLVFGPPDSVMREVVRTLGTGWFASGIEEAAQALRNLHARFASGCWAATPNLGSVQTAQELASSFARCLDRATARPLTQNLRSPLAG
jgi:glycosyltransferase involved in cell wall biosynthesis